MVVVQAFGVWADYHSQDVPSDRTIPVYTHVYTSVPLVHSMLKTTTKHLHIL